MELSPKQQTIELVKSAENILILTHQNPDGDALGSLLALFLVLKKVGKKAIALVNDPVPSKLLFLSGLKEINQDIPAHKDFIISIDTTRAKVDKLSYRNFSSENKLKITITPLQGDFRAEDISCGSSFPKFDLIFVLDCPDLERVGEFYDENPQLFYETPVINIDHHAGNDYFGKVNWIDLTSTSTSEILVSLIESLGRDKNLLDPDVATDLLAGIITDTGSFQNANTTPKSFTVAAQLVAAGGQQQEIVKNLFKTKSFSTLKLWGKVLSSLHEEKDYRFVWSKVYAADFEENNADFHETSGVIDELLKTAPAIDFALLLSERGANVHGSLRAVEKGVSVAEIAALFGGGGHEAAAAFSLENTNLGEAEAQILNKIRAYQAKRMQKETSLQMPAEEGKELEVPQDFEPAQ